MRENFLREISVQPPQKRILLNVLVIGFISLCYILLAHLQTPKTEVPLLLNSGLPSAGYSDISMVVFFEDSKSIGDVYKKIPQERWDWEVKELIRPSGVTAVTLSGTYRAHSPNDELRVYNQYQKLTKYVKTQNGSVYLHERIPESIDPAAYLSLVGAKPKQWIKGENTFSIAAHRDNIAPAVVAGSDVINIQLLTRSNKSSSATVLALPVLLEEF